MLVDIKVYVQVNIWEVNVFESLDIISRGMQRLMNFKWKCRTWNLDSVMEYYS